MLFDIRDFYRDEMRCNGYAGYDLPLEGDGKVLYQSPVLTEKKTQAVSVSVEGVDTLELLTESGKEGNACCWAVWGAPTLRR